MKHLRTFALVAPLCVMGCSTDDATPVPVAPVAPIAADAAAPSAPSAADTALPSGISEADFKALHTLTGTERPAPQGSFVHLAGGKAYLALPQEGTAPVPAVLLIHEWWGLNEHVKFWADRLANDGYAALAVDLYDGKIATTADDAMAYMKQVDPDRARSVLAAGHIFLGSHPSVKATKRAVMGWCFGGHWSLQAAIQTPDLDAAVIYYGRLITDPEQLKKISCPIVGVFGSQDTGIPPSAVQEWQAAMQAAGHDALTVHSFDAPHAFANPSNSRYDAEAAEAAWSKVRPFLAAQLKQ